MAVYVVMEPPGEAGQAERARLIRDGFSWLAFLLPPLWLLWHRLWIEALLAFVALGLLSAPGGMAGFGLARWSVTLLISLYVGLEGQAMRVNALRRRGWREWGVVSADRFEDAEARYAYGGEEEMIAEPAPAPVIVPDASRARPAQTGLALGLAHTPGAVVMRVAIIDYGSGNLRSATKAFERAAREAGIAAEIDLTADAGRVRSADRIVLPGVGAYADCAAGLRAVDGMWEAVEEAAVQRARPFLGICVGMQLMSERGLEKTVTEGLGWIAGDVKEIQPDDPALKIPQIGWNTIELKRQHPLFDGIPTGPSGLHAYFVHSYHLAARKPDEVLAVTDYGGPVTAAVARDNLAGTQFHPEKSQALGLALIANFLRWRP